MTDKSFVVSFRVALRLLLSAGWLCVVAPAAGQTFSWNTGSATWDNTASRWTPLGPPGAGDDALLGDLAVAANAVVTLGVDTPALNLLEVSGGVDLLTSGFDGEAVTVNITGAGSRLVIEDGAIIGSNFENADGATNVTFGGLLLVEEGASYDGGDVTLSSGGDAQLTGGVLVIRSNPNDGFLHINSGSEVFGWGTVDFGDSGAINGDLLVNEGTIRTARPFPLDVGTRRELVFDFTHPSETGAYADLDGTSEIGALSLAHTTTLTIVSNLNDDFSSSIDLRPGSILNISQPWAIDNGAVIDVDAVQLMPLIPSFFARIEGGEFTVESGSTINVNSGRLEIDADFTAETGSVIDVMDNSTLELGAAAEILDAEAINLTHDGTTLVVNGTTTIIDTAGQFDWDGNGTNTGHATTEVNEGALLEIDVDRFDAIGAGSDHLTYDGTLNVNGGTVDVRVNNTSRWFMDRNLNLQNTNGTAAEIIGNSLEIGNSVGMLDADLNVTGTGISRISVDELTFRSDADVDVAAGATLDLPGGIVFFDGGEYTGSGTIKGTANKFVTGSTTIGQPGTHTLTFDLSGNPVNIDSGDALTLHLAALNSNNTVFASIEIEDGALLDVNLPADTTWVYGGGAIEYLGDATIDTFLAGSPVEFAAATNVFVNGSGQITARVDIAGDVHINDAGEQLILDGGISAEPNRLSGGTINGPGELVVGEIFHDRTLAGFGVINANIAGSLTSRLYADDGRLDVNGSVSGFIQVLVTDDGVLNLDATFNTANHQEGLRMFGGEVTGGLIRNNGGEIEGYGRITSMSVNNFGRIEANGGTLVIDTVNPSQLDGAAPNNGQGILSAVFGDIEVASNVTTNFNGLLEVGDDRTFSMSRPGSRFRNAPASEDDDGSGDFGRVELTGGTIVATTFEQASELAAYGSNHSSIDAENIVFENGSLTEIRQPTDRLTLNGSTVIEPAASFTGNGFLAAGIGSSLALSDGVQIGVPLANSGIMTIGNSPGTATVDRFVQGSDGTWIVEIGGTAPGTQFDQLVVSGDSTFGGHADLGGTLEVELVDLGGGVFAPSPGHTFEILVADLVLDEFNETLLPDLSPGFFWHLIIQTDAVLLAVADHIAGDYNRNGVVDTADFVIWRKTEGSTTDLVADGNLDGTVDDLDFSIWRANFGAIAASSSLAGGSHSRLAAVPEPPSIALAVFAALAACRAKFTRKRA
jgi:hypothetical protein